MNQETKKKALLLENNPKVLEKIQQILRDKPYEQVCFTGKTEALDALKETFFPLAVTGLTENDDDPVDVMKTMVMTSPMTSIIMVTDLSDTEVDEKAEGYGILGNVGRDVPPKDLLSLIDAFEKIQQSFTRG